MKKNYSLMMAFAAVMILGAGCSKEKTSVENTDNLVITTNINANYEATKAVTTSFAGSTIGVFVDDAADIYSPTTNSIAEVSTGDNSVEPSPAININADATVYAWYPATTEELSDPSSSSTKVIDILNKDDFSATSQTDYLWATPIEVTKANRNTSLAFNR